MAEIEEEDKRIHEDKFEIIGGFHKNKVYGRRGRKATLKKMRDHNVGWRGLSRDVTRYIEQCDSCQANKLGPNPIQPMVITDTPTRPLQKTFLDIKGPLPVTERENKYLLTFMDSFTKYTFMIPIQN